MRCPWYLFHRLFFGCGFSVGKDTGAPWSPIAWEPHELSVCPWTVLMALGRKGLHEGRSKG
ncbi:unnamed protein product [Staurois parvus]|uniref:Uncharacterized protein n=1 Tax=Staurois parvus TaxID=386267 RepID=A0ABN9HJC8_9NEOB|nr:unnamed protein product [Staurois parvus]